MPSNEDVVHSSRFGGEVMRYHTWPTLRRQTVMDHTGHVIRIYWDLFEEVPPEVCAYLIHHDLPEVKVGDPPHPVKLHNPRLKEVYDDLEDATLAEQIGEERAQQVLGNVTTKERLRMKLCDLLEMVEFASIEWNLGNRYAWPIFEKVGAAIDGLLLDDADKALGIDYFNRLVRSTHT